MAQVKKEKTPAQVAADKARENVKAAREKLEKNKNAANETAYKAAKEAAEPVFQAERRDRFERMAGLRVANAIAAIQLLEKLTPKSAYHYTQADVDKFSAALNAELTRVQGRYTAALSTVAPGAKKAAAKQVFKF